MKVGTVKFVSKVSFWVEDREFRQKFEKDQKEFTLFRI
jgi:hypothetical protein